MTKEETIMAPYLAAGKEEIRLKRLLERRRKIDAAIAACMAKRREFMDKVHLDHWHANEPVVLPEIEEAVIPKVV